MATQTNDANVQGTNGNGEGEGKTPTLATRIRHGFVEFMDAVIAAGKTAENAFAVAKVDPKLIQNLYSLRDEIGEGRQGLTLEERAKNVQDEIDEHFAAMPLKNGKPAPTAEYNETTLKLLARQARIERSIREGGDHPEPKGKGDEKTDPEQSAK